jgi:Pentapeptide repeats (8 copies)
VAEPGSFPAAAAGIRDTAKWLLAAFGAIATVLVAGVQFSGIAKLTSPAREEALALGAVGLLGLAWAITGVAQLLLPRSYTMRELAKAGRGRESEVRAALESRSELLGGYETVEALAQALDEATTSYRAAQKAWTAAKEEARPIAEVTVNERVAALNAVTKITRYAGDWGNYWGLRLDFTYVLNWRILPGLAIALVGFAGLLLLTGKTEPVAAGLRAIELGPGSSLAGAQLAGSDVSGATLRGVSFRGADLSGANLGGSDLSGSDFQAANLRGANLTGATLLNVHWLQTTCPDGVNSDTVGGSCDAHLTVAASTLPP